MSDSALYVCNPPVPYRAGFIGTGEDAKPFFFHCVDCMREIYPQMPNSHFEQPIAAMVARPGLANPSWDDIHVVALGDGPCDYTPAIYCVEHARERWPEQMEAAA